MDSISKDTLADAEVKIKEMEDLEDYYFGADKECKMKTLADSVASIVDAAQREVGGDLRKLRVRGSYLRGRATSLLPGQEAAAEALLSKAIKLDPQCLDAWNVLGEVYWNQQSYAQSRDCFEQAIDLCGANSVSLRNLSMVLRAVEGDRGGDQESAARRSQNYALALENAKKAVALDTNDPENWETLGNAYVGDFFVNARRPDEINRALIAYQKADAIYEKWGKRNPTLQLNRGMAAKYIEDYNLAFCSFKKAHEIGAAGAAEQGQKVLELVQRLASYAERKADLKVKRLKELLADFPTGRSLAELRSGENASTPVVARVVAIIERKDEVPVILVCCDGAGDFFALSIYNAELSKVAESLVPMKSLIRIQQPKFRQIILSGPGSKEISYPCARVAHPNDIGVVGGGSLGVAAVQSLFSAGAARVSAAVPATASADSAERNAAPSSTPAEEATCSPNGNGKAAAEEKQSVSGKASKSKQRKSATAPKAAA